MDAIAPPARSRKPRGQGASRRGEILDAAKRLFLQHGVEHATMRRIAAEVGVSSTALYVYFPDKAAILEAIAEAMFEALLVTHAATRSAAEPPLARFRAGMRAYVDLALARPDEYRLTFGASPLRACRTIPAAEQSFDMLEQDVAQMMREGMFATCDPRCVAEALWACLHGVVTLLLNQPEHIATAPTVLIDTVIDVAIRGVLASD